MSRPSGSDVVTVSGTVPNRYFRWAVPLSIDDPPKFFGAALKSRLKAAGIELTGNVVERPMPADNAWILVASTESDIIPTLAIANKRSQSFYAEQIFKTLAYEKSGRGTWESALGLAEPVPRRAGSRCLALRAARRLGPLVGEPGIRDRHGRRSCEP